MNKLSRGILLKAKNAEGRRILSIKDYYEDKISPRAEKYSRYSFTRSNTVVCPFHVDNDPSFGVLVDKSGKERYHCFGCGVTGDYIDFYIAMEKSFFGRYLNAESAISELATKFGISLEELPTKNSDGGVGKYDSVLSGYHEADFLRDFRKGLITGKSLAYFNIKLLTLIGSNFVPKEID